MLRIGPRCAWPVAGHHRATATDDFLPFFATMLCGGDLARSPSSQSPLSIFSSNAATANVTAAAPTTPRVTAEVVCPWRVCAYTAKIDPGPPAPGAHVERHVDDDAGHAAGDHGEDQARLHQHVGEVDLVDAAEELDDRRAGGGRLRHTPCRRTSRPAAGRGPDRGSPRAGTAPTCRSPPPPAMPSGVSTPWLMALLRKRTFAGSMTIEVSGSRLLSTSHSTALPRTSMTSLTTGRATKNPRSPYARQDAGRELVDEHLEAGLDLARPRGRRAAS